jgi:tetratricopeptide (TPR) repeat protein
LAKSIYNVNIAGFYLIYGNTEKSLYLNEYARDKLANKKGWKFTAARCYNNLAKSYYSLGDYENAIKLFKSARKIFLQKNKQIYIALKSPIQILSGILTRFLNITQLKFYREPGKKILLCGKEFFSQYYNNYSIL